MPACRQHLLNVEAAAEHLGLTPVAPRQKTTSGEVPCVRINAKLRFDQRDLSIDSGLAPATPGAQTYVDFPFFK